jgi:hypothetical protein
MKRIPQVELSTVAYSAEHASRVGTKHTTPEVKFSEKPEDLHINLHIFTVSRNNMCICSYLRTSAKHLKSADLYRS